MEQIQERLSVVESLDDVLFDPGKRVQEHQRLRLRIRRGGTHLISPFAIHLGTVS